MKQTLDQAIINEFQLGTLCSHQQIENVYLSKAATKMYESYRKHDHTPHVMLVYAYCIIEEVALPFPTEDAYAYWGAGFSFQGHPTVKLLLKPRQ